MGPLVFISWIALSFIVGVYANSRGRNGVVWGILAFLLSPLLSWLILLAMGRPGPNADTHKKCPACAEWCANEAKVCKHCGNRFPGMEPEQTNARTAVNTGEFTG